MNTAIGSAIAPPIPILALLVLCWGTLAHGEGILVSNGYQFSNVHVWQHGDRVIAEGRVQGGSPCAALNITVAARNDGGETVHMSVRMANYTGRGELFEARRRLTRYSGTWQLEAVEAIPQGALETTPRPIRPSPIPMPAPTAPVDTGPRTFTTYQNAKTVGVANPSWVLLTAQHHVSLIVRDATTGKVVLVKNIDPHNLEEIPLPKGRYTARILSQGETRDQEFTLRDEHEVINLN